MTNEEILKKAIEKAVKNGFPPAILGDKTCFKDYNDYDWECVLEMGYMDIIFSHDFARAFFGVINMASVDSIVNDDDGPIKISKTLFGWEYHLQQLVLEKEPLKYLEKFL